MTIKIVKGSDNVYKDLGFKNPEKWQKKADIARRIEAKIYELLGITIFDLNEISKGLFGKFSLDELNNILNKLEEC